MPIASASGTSARAAPWPGPARMQRAAPAGRQIVCDPFMARAPMASTRACSAASNIGRVSVDRRAEAIVNLVFVIGAAQRIGIARAAHHGDFVRRQIARGQGQLGPEALQRGGSALNCDFQFGFARERPARRATARLKGSDGFLVSWSSVLLTPPALWRRSPAIPRRRRADRIRPRWRAPVHRICSGTSGERRNRHRRNLGIFRPGNDRARAHHGRQVAVDEGIAGHVGHADHGLDRLLAFRRAA